MQVRSTTFADGGRLPAECAAGIPGPDGPVPGPNKSPHLAWSDLPAGTRSLAVVCHDRDVPSRPDDVNKPDRPVPYDLPRVDFHHWVLVDVSPDRRELPLGADSDGFVPRGKKPGPTPHGVRGVNDYTAWFAGDADMRGDYGGYDGPWPPFNDERLHHYVFTVYALDVPTLALPARFTGPEAIAAMRGHVLASAAQTAIYALNPKARP